MDLQSFIDKTIKAQRKAKLEESHQMTLGELIKKLEAVEPKQGDDEQSVVFDFEFLAPTTLDSWRGSYDELAIGWTYRGYAPEGCPDHNGSNDTKLTGFLKELKDAVGKTFEGWKGGDFVMTETTPIWVANPGNTGNTGITEVVDNGYEVILMTGYYEY